MKKNYVILATILLATLFVACGDSNNENPGGGGITNPIDVKKTPEYAVYGVENVEIGYSLLDKERLAGDVKTARMMWHTIIKWNETEKETLVNGKTELTFNKSGLLEKMESFERNDKNIELVLWSSIEVQYDKYNRTVHVDRRAYGEYGSLSNGIIYEYTYDDVNNKVSVVVSEIEKTGVTTALNKHVSNLDQYGHLGTSDVTEFFYPKAAQLGKALPKAEPTTVSSEIFKIARDHKNNILSAYLLLYGEDAPYSYYTQELSYHDGSKSVAGAVKDELQGGGFVAETLAAKNLVGNVKQVARSYYFDRESQWDENKKKVIWGSIHSTMVYSYNSDGYLIGEHRTYPEPIFDAIEYKVDAKGRITEKQEGTVQYTITYDDANKQATLIGYDSDGKISNKYIYKLAADGTISENNYGIVPVDNYVASTTSSSSLRNTKAAASAETQFEETPSVMLRRYEKKDAKGNITEYAFITINNKTQVSTVSDSYTRTITYY